MLHRDVLFLRQCRQLANKLVQAIDLFLLGFPPRLQIPHGQFERGYITRLRLYGKQHPAGQQRPNTGNRNDDQAADGDTIAGGWTTLRHGESVARLGIPPLPETVRLLPRPLPTWHCVWCGRAPVIAAVKDGDTIAYACVTHMVLLPAVLEGLEISQSSPLVRGTNCVVEW